MEVTVIEKLLQGNITSSNQELCKEMPITSFLFYNGGNCDREALRSFYKEI
jgi:hypothetical protein